MSISFIFKSLRWLLAIILTGARDYVVISQSWVVSREQSSIFITHHCHGRDTDTKVLVHKPYHSDIFLRQEECVGNNILFYIPSCKSYHHSLYYLHLYPYSPGARGARIVSTICRCHSLSVYKLDKIKFPSLSLSWV